MTGVWFSSHWGSPLMSLCMRKNEGICEELMFQEEEKRGALILQYEVAWQVWGWGSWSVWLSCVSYTSAFSETNIACATYMEAMGSQQSWWALKCLKLPALNSDQHPGIFPAQTAQTTLDQSWATAMSSIHQELLHIWAAWRAATRGGKKIKR